MEKNWSNWWRHYDVIRQKFKILARTMHIRFFYLSNKKKQLGSIYCSSIYLGHMNLSLFQKIDCMAWSRDDCDVIMQIRLLIFSGYEVEWVNIQWQKVWLSYVGQFLRSGSANIAQFSKVKILPQIITSYYILLLLYISH